MRPTIQELHAFHVRNQADERLARLVAALPAESRLKVEEAMLDYEQASWALYESLRRNGYKAERAKAIATGARDE